MVRQGRADLTRVKYVHGVRAFLEWHGKGLADDVRTADIDLFLAQWEAGWETQTGRRPSRATVRARISALRSFFLYLERAGLLVDEGGHAVSNPMAGVVAPSLEQRPNDFLRPIEDAALLECQSPPAERLVVWFLRWTGVRVSEACGLRLEDLDLSPGSESVVVRRSKTTAGVRTIP